MKSAPACGALFIDGSVADLRLPNGLRRYAKGNGKGTPEGVGERDFCL